MREHKYRAYNKKTREWADSVVVYGDGSWQARFGNVEGYSEEDGVELMQFTGLKDRSGQPIYEGDILVHRYQVGESLYEAKIGETSQEVEGETFTYYGTYFVFLKGMVKPYGGEKVSGYWFPSAGELEIIGTIYENSELLPDTKR